MTPDEARAAIKAGLAGKLMLEYWTGLDPIFVLAPAAVGYEGRRAPNTDELFGDRPALETFFMRRKPGTGTCVMLENDRCKIHDSGFKPTECRVSNGCAAHFNHRREIKELWDNADAQSLVSEWMEMVGLDAAVKEECT